MNKEVIVFAGNGLGWFGGKQGHQRGAFCQNERHCRRRDTWRLTTLAGHTPLDGPVRRASIR